MINLIEKYMHCEYIDPKKAAEYVFECAENFINEKLQNETIDLNYFSGTQVWNMPPTILFKNKIPYSEEWIKDFGRVFYDIKKINLLLKQSIMLNSKYRLHKVMIVGSLVILINGLAE